MFDLIRRDFAVAVRINRGQDRRTGFWTRSVRTAFAIARTLAVSRTALPLVAGPLLVTATVLACTVLVTLSVTTLHLPASIFAPLLVASRILSAFVLTSLFSPRTFVVAASVVPISLLLSALVVAASILAAVIFTTLCLAVALFLTRLVTVPLPLFSCRKIAQFALPRLLLRQARHAPNGRADQRQSQRVLSHNPLL
jgi:hypothetical protein